MDKTSESRSSVLGPEWLSYSSNTIDPHNFKTTREYFLSSKQQSVKFTRSKSTPLLLPQNVEPVLAEPKQSDVFGELREHNTFERDFPSLNGTGKAPVQPEKKEGAWRNLALQEEKKTLAPAQRRPGSPSLNAAPHDDRIEELRSLVPVIQTSKIRKEQGGKKVPLKAELNRVNGVKRTEISSLRKATSEPMLQIPPAYADNYSKLIAKKPAPPREEKGKGTVLLNRAEYLKGLVSPKHEPVEAPPTPTRKTSDPVVPVTFIVMPRSAPITSKDQSPDQDSEIANATLILDADEERFLRNLGWVPDEEDHVPALTPEEISQMQRTLNAQKCQK
eukprot:TRINITY_DN2681_c0_g1_i2.p5 TRINITY_DN2681_c0_g1~~TRINITY_DN2681_c0_g1_i2.p5  ORF type:complete len:333 (-),score=72.85 TRINITY_DN2681_c0_g1_i2:2526-3524(-)